jgi:hypothetical protein
MRTKSDPIQNLPFDYRRRKFVKLELPPCGCIIRRFFLDKTARIERRLLC